MFKSEYLKSIIYLDGNTETLLMKTAFSLLLILLFFASCSKKNQAPTEALSTSQESTQQVLDHHWKAFKANDLEGTMADYTEESFLITPDKTYKGLAEIRQN